MNKFGYSEMYEWSELFEFNIVPYGRFVSFDNNEPGKIKLANNNDNIIGVTTINSVITSDDPNEWQGKYLCNEYGDCFLQKKDNICYAESLENQKNPIPNKTPRIWLCQSLCGNFILNTRFQGLIGLG